MIHRITQEIKATRIIILAVALLTFCFIASGTNTAIELEECGLLKGCEVEYNKFFCTPDNCSGFEGIFSCLEEGAQVAGGGIRAAPSRKGGPDIRVTKTFETIDDKNISYSVEVSNDGGTNLENVEFVDILPNGLEYQNGAILSFTRYNGNEENRGLTEPNYKVPSEDHMNLTWILGDLRIMEDAHIKMIVTKLGSAIKPSANKAYVQGNWTNETVKDSAMAEEVSQAD